MNKKEINNGLKEAVYSSSITLPVHWPNVDPPAVGNYITMAINATSREDTTLKGGNAILREEGLLNFLVVIGLDVVGGEDDANDIADSIAAIFPPASQISINGGVIDFRSTPVIRGGYRDGSEWKVPVTVPYSARAT